MAHLTTFDIIANLKPIPRDRLKLVEPGYQTVEYLPIGQVGTILEVYQGTTPRYLVEFADLQGQEYAMAVLTPDEVMALHYELSLAK
jgi:hypothetical protein